MDYWHGSNDAAWDRAQDDLFAAGLTDGLPVTPPTRERVEAMLAHCGFTSPVGVVITRSGSFAAGDGNGGSAPVTRISPTFRPYSQAVTLVGHATGVSTSVTAGAAIIGPPVVAAIAPVIGAAATVSGAVAGTAYFYSKWREKKAGAGEQALDSENKNTSPDAESSHKPE